MEIEYLKVEGFEAAIRGMRNPKESWKLSDSGYAPTGNFFIGENDLDLMCRLVKANHSSHRKFLRMVMITCDVTSNSVFWREWDTYKHTVRNSTSQMHKLGSRLLTVDDFESEVESETIDDINYKIKIWQAEGKHPNTPSWYNMLYAIPQGFLYRSTIQMSYETFINQYVMRKNHLLNSWVEYCKFLRKNLPYMDILLTVLDEKSKKVQ